MSEVFFNEADQEAFPFREASDLALAWLVAKAANEALEVMIVGDYEWVSIRSASSYDCIGESLNWAPLEHAGERVVSREMFSRGVSLIAIDDAWVAYTRAEPGRRFSDANPLRASCMAVVYDAFGDRVSAPVQLQRCDQLKAELRERRERERADEALASRDEALWAYEP